LNLKKTNKTCSVELLGEGEGGLAEIGQQLKQYPDRAIFGVIKVKFFDEMATKKGSPYVKFIYFRFLGTKVNVMTKGFLTPRLGSIDDVFPVKHLSYDIDENLTKFDQKTIANDFLRVSDNKVEASSFDFGPNQIYNSQPEKVVNTNKKPQPQVQPKAKTTQPKEKPKKRLNRNPNLNLKFNLKIMMTMMRKKINNKKNKTMIMPIITITMMITMPMMMPTIIITIVMVMRM